MNTVVTKKQVNRLTAAIQYKLCNTLAALNQAGGITVDSNWKGLAEYCSKMLEHEITPANVQGAFQVLELKLPQAPKTREQQLEDRIESLENALRSLYGNLNVPYPFQ